MKEVPYTNVVDSLMYIQIYTRPDLAYAMSLVIYGETYITALGGYEMDLQVFERNI